MEKSKRTFRGSYPAYALTYFFFYWSLGVFTSVLSMYLTGIGKSKAEMSFIMSASSLFGVVLIPIVGYINDKLRKPRLICTVMMACVAVFGILFALVRETMLLFLLNGCIMGFISSLSPVSERMATSTKYRYGTIRIWGTFGYAAAVQVACAMMEFTSPQLIFVSVSVSAVLAIMGRPLVARISRGRIGRWRVPRWCGALVTLLVIWIVFAVMCGLFVPLVTNKLYQLAHLDFSTVLTSVEEPLQRIQDYLTHFFSLPETQVSFKDTLILFLQSLINFDTINTAFSSVVSLAVSSVIAFFSISFITFFFLRDDGLFYAMVTALFPDRYQQNVTHALNSVTVLLFRYFRGILAESFLLMLAVSLVMMAFGMRAQDAFFIGLIMGVMNVVPYAGPTIGGAVSVCMGIITPIEGMSIGHTMLVIAGSLLILKGLDDFVLQPTLYSERVKAQPLEIFLVILIAGSLAGVIGMLLAIPLYTVLRVFAKEFFSQISLVRKLTEKI